MAQVVLEGRFDERDIQVAPSLQEFLSIARFLQLGVLGILAGLPCLLEHPEVEPFIRMSEELGFGLDLSGGGQYGETNIRYTDSSPACSSVPNVGE